MSVWRARYNAFLERKERVRIVFERHRTFLSLSATILSCLAAIVTYQSRRMHQQKLESQLERIQRELEMEQQILQAAEIAKIRDKNSRGTLLGEKKYVSASCFDVPRHWLSPAHVVSQCSCLAFLT